MDLIKMIGLARIISRARRLERDSIPLDIARRSEYCIGMATFTRWSLENRPALKKRKK